MSKKNNWKGKRVFVSGGAGVIGTALVNELIQNGATILVGDLKPQPTEWSSQLLYRQGDLVTISEKELQAFSPEVFFHLAATFERTEETASFWEENFHHNILLSHHLMSLLKNISTLKTVIFASSYLVYNPSLYLFNQPQIQPVELQENSSVLPRNLCGMAKWLHEQELQFLQRHHPSLQIVSARIFRSYGKNSRDIISRWIRALLKEEMLYVYQPEGMFDFVYAEDVAKSLFFLAETSFRGVVNIGTGKAVSVQHLLTLLKSHFPRMRSVCEKSKILFEASQAELSILHSLLPACNFRPLEKTIPLLIEYEMKAENALN